MFLPSSVRLLSIGVYLSVAWAFLSIACIVGAGAVVLVLDARSESLVLLAIAPFFLYVGVMALQRLRDTLRGSTLGM